MFGCTLLSLSIVQDCRFLLLYFSLSFSTKNANFGKSFVNYREGLKGGLPLHLWNEDMWRLFLEKEKALNHGILGGSKFYHLNLEGPVMAVDLYISRQWTNRCMSKQLGFIASWLGSFGHSICFDTIVFFFNLNFILYFILDDQDWNLDGYMPSHSQDHKC